MRHFKNIFFFYSSFSGKSGRIEFGIYLLVNILTYIIGIHLHENINLDNEKILNFFYICFIILFTFIPIQAATTRRLHDLNVNTTYLIFNFIPVLNVVFKIFLLLAKRNTKEEID